MCHWSANPKTFLLSVFQSRTVFEYSKPAHVSQLPQTLMLRWMTAVPVKHAQTAVCYIRNTLFRCHHIQNMVVSYLCLLTWNFEIQNMKSIWRFHQSIFWYVGYWYNINVHVNLLTYLLPQICSTLRFIVCSKTYYSFNSFFFFNQNYSTFKMPSCSSCVT